MNSYTRSAEHHTILQSDAFDPSSGTLVERLLFNHRSIILGICVLLSLLLGYQALSLKLNAAFEKMIPTDHPYVQNYLKNRGQLGEGGNTLRIAIEAKQGSIFDAVYLETVKKINDEVFLLPGVDRSYMKSLWTPATRWIGVTEEGFDGGPVIPDDYNGSAQSLDQVRHNVDRSGEVGRLVASNFKSSIVLLPLQDIISDDGKPLDYSVLSGQLEQIRAKYETDNIKIHITGFAKVVGDLIDGMRQMQLFFAATLVICGIVLFWYTRCVRSTLLVLLCSIIAVVWLLGLLPTLGFDLDPYSILVPFLVFAIGLSHGAQKMNGIMQDIGRGADKLVAARFTFRRLFLTGLMALVADAVGFAVLMIIKIPVIQDLAVAATIGVLTLIFTNLILLPILLSYTGVSKAAAQREAENDKFSQLDAHHTRHPFWAFLDRFTERKWASGAIIVAVILGVAGFAVSLHVKIGDLNPGAPELRPESRYNSDNRFMVSNFSASSDKYVVMVKTPQYYCANYQTLVSVDALEAQLQQLQGVVSTTSLAALSKQAAAGMNEGSMTWYEIPRNQGLLNAIITRAPRELFNQNCDLLTVYVYLKDHKADTLTSVVQTVEQFAATHNSDQIQFLNAAGNAGIEAATNIVVKRSNVQMLFMVYAAVIALCFITFRSWRAVVCTVLPLMLTSILCEALMVGLGIGVKVATLPVIALGVGIGVDYALYILSVTLTNLRSGRSLSEAYYLALLSTGKVVVMTGITLGIAVLTWVLSPIKFQADMGILLGFMFIWNMVGALILVPALAHFLLKSKPSSVNA
ncbi:RND transporter [Pseudomonas sp. FW215-R2]|uniref:efflux RND transporter permease subunit n=1 Tax=unclassified Pseudomonas TaxID=196821 RepID=UPI000C88744F|nr:MULTISPECIES: MMPL family transporter [unclassified Pseudomonas]PMX03082.1 RND transporter [Pseudomonas sp. FW215-R2]PMX11953.1 RND transporter [Pseudomonas sp. FW215-L1]PMX25623.1 RND transporter [Pseudomonas sp. FW215-E1]PNA32625.1 RND transporter [Pseudomonas sp. FW215-R4]